VTETGIAQQAILSGHMLLPLFESCYSGEPISGDSAEAKDKEKQRYARVNKLEAILANSAIIRRNWLCYKLRRELSATKTALSTFHLASQISWNGSMLKMCCPFGGFRWRWVPAHGVCPEHWKLRSPEYGKLCRRGWNYKGECISTRRIWTCW